MNNENELNSDVLVASNNFITKTRKFTFKMIPIIIIIIISNMIKRNLRLI